MAQTTWEKVAGADEKAASVRSSGRWKFLVGGVAILAAVAYLIISGTSSGARFFISVNDLLAEERYVGQTVRVTGAVIGDTIFYDSERLLMEFTVAHIPSETPDRALALYQAVNDPEAARIPVRVEGQPRPDLLQHEAQAIMTGVLGPDGLFRATEVLFKCPSRYGEADPNQVIAEPGS
jgi:cytochrome c-type biogenesis protein CcmE